MNKKNKRILTSVVIIIAIGGGLFFINKDNSKTMSDNNDNSNIKKFDGSVWGAENLSELPTQLSSENEIKAPSEESLDIDKIESFKQGNGIDLPYTVGTTPIVIENIGQYSGVFVEDGSNISVDNVLSVIVKNNSDEMIQYGEFELKNSDGEVAVFKVSNLPPKTSALVCESTGKIKYKEECKYEVTDSIHASLNETSLLNDKLDIKKENNKLTITNKTEDNLGTVYVYYKYKQDGGAYLGGITYRTKFENVTSKATIEADTAHFNVNTSEIIMVDYIN